MMILTMMQGPSKKIKMNISGEPSSVYYCHLCGQEYMVKFNLQKHLEANHSVQVISDSNLSLICFFMKSLKLISSLSDYISIHNCSTYIVLCTMLVWFLSPLLIVDLQERTAPPESLIKCKLCDAIFYNKKAWESHNLLHSPDDLYIKTEADRKLAVARYGENIVTLLHIFLQSSAINR